MTPGAPKMTSGAPKMTPGAPKMTPGAPKMNLGAPKMTTGAPNVTRGAPKVSLGAPKVTLGVHFGSILGAFFDDFLSFVRYEFPVPFLITFFMISGSILAPFWVIFERLLMESVVRNGKRDFHENLLKPMVFNDFCVPTDTVFHDNACFLRSERYIFSSTDFSWIS